MEEGLEGKKGRVLRSLKKERRRETIQVGKIRNEGVEEEKEKTNLLNHHLIFCKGKGMMRLLIRA